MYPWNAPNAAPTATPTASTMAQRNGVSGPSPISVSQLACSCAMNMATNPTSEPTDRSMLRDTMTRTMPVAMTAIPAAWTPSVTMLTGRRNVPPLMKWKPIRMIARAASIPNRRRSISVCARRPRQPARGAT